MRPMCNMHLQQMTHLNSPMISGAENDIYHSADMVMELADPMRLP